MKINSDLIVSGSNKTLNEIYNRAYQTTGDVLWMNPDDNREFTSQTISNLDFSQYAYFKVFFKIEAGTNLYSVLEVPFMNTEMQCGEGRWSIYQSMDCYSQRSIRINNNGFWVSNAVSYGIGGASGVNISANKMIIPNRIVGYKYDFNQG